MKQLRFLILVLFIILIPLSTTAALTLKIGSLGPVDTPWDNAMKRVAIRWNEISNGRVTVKIYPGGIAGDEADMIRKVRIGQLDGVGLTGTGLNRITSDILALVIPLFFHTNDELSYVMENMFDDFSVIMEDKGFELVALAPSGWIKLFGKRPIFTPKDLQSQRLAVSAEDEEILYTWRSMGFDALPLHHTEILAGLQSGMAEAFHTPAIIAALYQWFALAPNMCTIDIAPLVTGLVIGERAWKRIPDQYKEEFIEAGREAMAPLYGEILELEDQAMQIMVENGLAVNQMTDQTLAEWDDIVSKAHDILVGTSISPEVYEKVTRLRDEYRRNHD